jgi:hypothetical protein
MICHAGAMNAFLARRGYRPLRALTQPLFFIFGLVLIVLSDASDHRGYVVTLLSEMSILAIAWYAAKSWRQARLREIEPLGSVTWPSPAPEGPDV